MKGLPEYTKQNLSYKGALFAYKLSNDKEFPLERSRHPFSRLNPGWSVPGTSPSRFRQYLRMENCFFIKLSC